MATNNDIKTVNQLVTVAGFATDSLMEALSVGQQSKELLMTTAERDHLTHALELVTIAHINLGLVKNSTLNQNVKE